MKASPEAQLRLLELADLDTEITRQEHRRRTVPEIAELDRLTARAEKARDALVAAETQLSDLGREQDRAERDVDQVRARITKDQTRLDGGSVSSAKELESLQSEVVSLKRRQSDLEEGVLELMERMEGLTAIRDAARGERDTIDAEIATVTARRDATLAEITEAAAKATQARDAVTAGMPADLLALYDKVRAAAAQHRRPGCAAAAARAAGSRCPWRSSARSAARHRTRSSGTRSAAESLFVLLSPDCNRTRPLEPASFNRLTVRGRTWQD